MKSKLIVPCFLLMLTVCRGGNEASQLDQILAELADLNEGLRRVEARMDSLENQIVTASVEAVQSTSASSTDGESANLIDRVVEAVKIREERVNFPWMEASLWSFLQEGMSTDEVEAILGEPTLEDPSLYKRIDLVYTYRGRKPATGEKIVGKVKFYKDKVVDIEAP